MDILSKHLNPFDIDLTWFNAICIRTCAIAVKISASVFLRVSIMKGIILAGGIREILVITTPHDKGIFCPSPSG
jgi:hypothetical protein